MELIVVGAGPAYTDREDASGAAYLLRHADASLLLDLGQGSFARLFRHVEPSTLRGVVVSHLHPDHFIDLVPLRHYLRFEFDPRRRVEVYAPRGLADRLDALHAAPGFTAEALDCVDVGVGRREIGPFALESALVLHTDESYAYRVAANGHDDAPGLVYSGDCGRAEDLEALLRPGDALLVEVSFGPGPVASGAFHLDGPSIGRVAARAAAGRVLLTHLQMGFDPDETVRSVRAAGFAGDVEFVWPGTRTQLPHT